MKAPGNVLVGITGNSGCGQSTAASCASDFAAGVCSLDEVGHRLLRRTYVQAELERELGIHGAADMEPAELRRLLSGMVFGDPSRMALLNGILHPRMVRWARMTSFRLSAFEGVWILEGALIFELGLAELMDCTITVVDTLERCAGRLALRDGITPDSAALRWRSQLPLSEKASRSDHVVENSGDLDYLKRQIVSIFTGFSGKPVERS